MKSSIVFLAKLLVGLMLVSPTAKAAVITFDAGDETVGTSSPVTVPITVNDFTDVVSFQFTLQWDPGVIQYSSVGNFGLVDIGFGTDQVDTGSLIISWLDFEDLSGEDLLPNGSKLFDINFISANSPGSTDLLFTGTLEVSTLVGITITPQTFNPISGSVNVVPEPINIALGVFAGLFAGSTTLRWVFKKRAARSAA